MIANIINAATGASTRRIRLARDIQRVTELGRSHRPLSVPTRLRGMDRRIGAGVEIVFHDPPVPSLTIALEPVDWPVRPTRLRQHGCDRRAISIVEGEAEDLQGLVEMAGIARAHNDCGHLRLVEHMPRCHG